MKKLEKHHLNVPFVTSKSSFEVEKWTQARNTAIQNKQMVMGKWRITIGTRIPKSIGEKEDQGMLTQCILLSTATHLKIARKKRKRMYQKLEKLIRARLLVTFLHGTNNELSGPLSGRFSSRFSQFSYAADHYIVVKLYHKLVYENQ